MRRKHLRKSDPDSHSPGGYGRVTLARALSKLGVTSRNLARGLIEAGRVQINNEVVFRPNRWLNLNQDKVYLDGKLLSERPDKVYLILNKPAGCVTTRVDRMGRPTVYDLVPPLHRWLFPVGRLDMDTEGLLLMSDDGQIGELLTQPRSQVAKTYLAKIDRLVMPQDLQRLQEGTDLGDFVTMPAAARLVRTNRKTCWVKLTVHEGKNRQVRRMFEALDYQVLQLIRIQIGPLRLGNLKKGDWRLLDSQEVKRLLRKYPSGEART